MAMCILLSVCVRACIPVWVYLLSAVLCDRPTSFVFPGPLWAFSMSVGTSVCLKESVLESLCYFKEVSWLCVFGGCVCFSPRYTCLRSVCAWGCVFDTRVCVCTCTHSAHSVPASILLPQNTSGGVATGLPTAPWDMKSSVL